jgi:tetratricopeptide (TPR) repeat protein
VNLAGLASLEGDFERAESLYRDALSTWRDVGAWADAADALHGLGQLELRRGDYPAARAALNEALSILDRTGPLADALAVRRALADALAAAGQFQGGLDELRRAQRSADSAGAPAGARADLALARADLEYIGLIGSAAKATRFFARLSARGLVTAERWARVRTPVGLAILAETPAEIAVSIVAELVHVRAEARAAGTDGACPAR